MAELVHLIETMEHRWMRAWINGDRRTIKKLTSGNFRLLIGSRPAVILDAASWMEAATTRFRCTSYRFGDIYVRKHGAIAMFASQLDLEARLDSSDWSGRFWVSDLWRKTTVARNWRMVERVISQTVDDPELAPAIRSMQLWR